MDEAQIQKLELLHKKLMAACRAIMQERITEAELMVVRQEFIDFLDECMHKLEERIQAVKERRD